MARTVPAGYTAPEASGMSVGEFIGAADAAALDAATNSLMSWGGAINVWSQGWAREMCQSTAPLVAPVLMCELRFPQLSSYHGTLTVACRAHNTGGAGIVRFAAVNGASSVDLLVLAAAAPGAWYTGTITPTFGPGYETLRMSVAGGGYVTVVHDVAVYWTPAAGPLPAGQAATGEVPTDTLESADDLPWSARKGVQCRANLAVLRARRRMVIAWAGLLAPGLGDAPIHKAWPIPRLPGAEIAGAYDITVHALMDGAASATVLNLQPGEGELARLPSAGAGVQWAAPVTARVRPAQGFGDVPVPYGLAWYHRENGAAPPGWPAASAWPPRTASVGTTLAICAWGR